MNTAWTLEYKLTPSFSKADIRAPSIPSPLGHRWSSLDHIAHDILQLFSYSQAMLGVPCTLHSAVVLGHSFILAECELLCCHQACCWSLLQRAGRVGSGVAWVEIVLFSRFFVYNGTGFGLGWVALHMIWHL